MEADFAARRFRRCHQFPQSFKDCFQVFIVSQGLPFQRIQFARQFIHGNEHPAHTDERAHDFNIDGHSARTAENTGQHGDAFLGEGVGQVTPATVQT
jgi:hypothetical protein